MQLTERKKEKERTKQTDTLVKTPEKDTESIILRKLFTARNTRAIMYVLHRVSNAFDKHQCEYLSEKMRSSEWMKEVKVLYSNSDQLEKIRAFLMSKIDEDVENAVAKVCKEYTGYNKEAADEIAPLDETNQSDITVVVNKHPLREFILLYCQVETLILLRYLTLTHTGKETTIVNKTPWQTIPWVTTSYLENQPEVVITYKTIETALKNMKVAFGLKLVRSRKIELGRKSYKIYSLTEEGLAIAFKLFSKNKKLGKLIDYDYLLEIEREKTSTIIKSIRKNEYKTIFRVGKDIEKRYQSIEDRIQTVLWNYYPDNGTFDTKTPLIVILAENVEHRRRILENVEKNHSEVASRL
ncbi:MAG: hypothetical protein ACFFD4_30880, partial [Candidatus Odinarchaeota archaeon]